MSPKLAQTGMREASAFPGFPIWPVPLLPFPHVIQFRNSCYGFLGYHVRPELCNEGNRPHSPSTEKMELVQG